jgi:hypothetical protein
MFQDVARLLREKAALQAFNPLFASSSPHSCQLSFRSNFSSTYFYILDSSRTRALHSCHHVTPYIT